MLKIGLNTTPPCTDAHAQVPAYRSTNINTIGTRMTGKHTHSHQHIDSACIQHTRIEHHGPPPTQNRSMQGYKYLKQLHVWSDFFWNLE